ncbi:SAV_6107 family HEPN domain-containing protein [Nocardia alni]|uniref:SAV_6107 family HEPN domain-containing protein n=1 Tax=Nocardia alni TaxID=2815723 RepID=UPI001C232097|nr:SAV_6107 family HEPN domain-containing protein [Nocardia alni]
MAGRIEHPGRAGGLLDRAEAMLLEASGDPDPRERLRAAYLAALRGAGAVLALTGADRAPRARSRNAWVLMQQAAPEFVMWSDYFSSFSETRAAIEAGLDRPVDARQADEFVSRVAAFLHDVADSIDAAGRMRPITGWLADGSE